MSLISELSDLADTPEGLFYGAVTMNALFASAVWCVVAPNVRSLTALILCAIAWPLVNGPLEGNILWSIDREHGITVSDLLSVAAVVIALVKFRQLRVRSKRAGGNDSGRHGK